MSGPEHSARRQVLRDRIGTNAVAIVLAAPERLRSRDTHHPYRQDSDFFYLTGFPEPEAVAVFAPGRPEGEYLLFCRPRDPAREIWDGRRAGPEGALRDYGAEQAFTIAELGKLLPDLLGSRQRVFYTLGSRKAFDRRLAGWLNELKSQSRRGINAPPELVALDSLLHEMRLRKSLQELVLMRRAAEISAQAHRRAMCVCRPDRYEYQLAAEIRHEFEMNGATPAYGSIVGGGANGCILHYVENSAPLRAEDLVLVDAGAEFKNYCADLTRTFPVGGKFSGAQRALYEVVLAAQQAAIEQVKPGHHWNQPHDAAVRLLTEGLVSLGLLQGEVKELVETEAYKRFFMHSTGHWLGMDVYDVGAYKRDGVWRSFEPGMVLTVEPGLYVAPEAEGVDTRFRGIGIRIEDDVLVTAATPEVLTSGAPKAIAEVEALMA